MTTADEDTPQQIQEIQEPQEPEEQEPQEPEEPSSYQVSFERLKQLQRSAIAVVAERRPASCPSRQKPDHELKDPKKLINEIAEHAAKEEGFIRTEMPIQEIVFRVLLTRRNQPTLLQDLHYELTERWATPVRPINLTEKKLARILDADNYYGFVNVSTAE